MEKGAENGELSYMTEDARDPQKIVEIDGIKVANGPEYLELIPKNFKPRSRKDPNKDCSTTILTKDPLDLRLCPICGRKFYRAEHLKRHLTSVHSLEKPFECDSCGKKFTRKDNLNQHQKRKHGKIIRREPRSRSRGTEGPLTTPPSSSSFSSFQLDQN